MSLYNYSSAQNIQNKCYYSGNNIIKRIVDSDIVDKSIKDVFEKIGALGEKKKKEIAHILMSMVSNGKSFTDVNKEIDDPSISISEENFVQLKNFIQQQIKVVTNWSYFSGNRILSGLLFSGFGYNSKKCDDNLSKNDKMNIEKFMIALNHINGLQEQQSTLKDDQPPIKNLFSNDNTTQQTNIKVGPDKKGENPVKGPDTSNPYGNSSSKEQKDRIESYQQTVSDLKNNVLQLSQQNKLLITRYNMLTAH